MHIAVDGPAGAGKSTIGRGLAESLDCAYLDTGLMYRAVTREALRRGLSVENGAALAALAREIDFRVSEASERLLINGAEPNADLRHPDVDAAVSAVSAHPELRAELVRRQRELANDRCIVMVGRDIGTVVLPDATLKLWVTASAEERARRRAIEHAHVAHEASPAAVLDAIEARDRFDSGREHSPLEQAPDAIVIATDELTPAESLGAALEALGRARDSVSQSDR